ncbi:hypothetical protein BGZ97_009579, partial [Linnemannia gamsii]
LRRTSHKAAEQKRRDSLKHCFDDLRQMIPNIVDKAPSKVFLLKKSFDYICTLKAEMAQRDLTIARMQAQQEFFQQACRQWFESGGGGMPDMEGWKMSEEMLDQATRRELEIAQMTAEMAEQSAAAVEAARIGNQPGGGNGGNKDGKNSASSGVSKTANGGALSQVNGSSTSVINNQHQQQRQNTSSKDDSDDDEDDDSTPTASRRSSTTTTGTMSIAPSSASSTSTSTPTIHPLSGPPSSDVQMTSAFNASSSTSSSSSFGAPQKQHQHTRSKSSRSDDEDEEDEDEEEEGDDEEEEDYEGDQEMQSVQ